MKLGRVCGEQHGSACVLRKLILVQWGEAIGMGQVYKLNDHSVDQTTGTGSLEQITGRKGGRCKARSTGMTFRLDIEGEGTRRYRDKSQIAA